MAVDRGYGSGFNNTGMAKPSTPRARRARGSAKPATPLSKMSRAEYNARITQSQGARRVQQRRNDISGNMLEAFTGFNRKDGVDAGDFAGLAISIPTGGLSGIARAVGRAVVPKAARIAGAASRVVKGATSRLSAAEARIAAGEGMQAAGLAVKQSARNVPKTPRSVRLGLDWDNPVGNRPHQSYNYVIKDMTKGVNPEAPRSAWEISEAGRQMMNAGSNTAYNAAKAARRSQRVIDAGKAEAAAEIKRRLAALQRANRNR